jgi:hypothetical protein
MPNGYTPGGGLSAGWQKRLTPEQQASLDVQKVLYQHSRPYNRLLEDWQYEKQQEEGLSPEEWKRMVLSQPSDERVQEAINVALAFGMGIVNPKLKFEYQTRNKRGGFNSVKLRDTKTGEQVGSADFVYDPKEKQIDLQWADLFEQHQGGYGTGHLKHIVNELKKEFPDAETVSFGRVSGAREKHGVGGGRTMALKKEGRAKSKWDIPPEEQRARRAAVREEYRTPGRGWSSVAGGGERTPGRPYWELMQPDRVLSPAEIQTRERLALEQGVPTYDIPYGAIDVAMGRGNAARMAAADAEIDRILSEVISRRRR